MKKTSDLPTQKIKQHPFGEGSDKQHSNTPVDANQRFKNQQKKKNVQDNPGEQSTG